MLFGQNDSSSFNRFLVNRVWLDILSLVMISISNKLTNFFTPCFDPVSRVPGESQEGSTLHMT